MILAASDPASIAAAIVVVLVAVFLGIKEYRQESVRLAREKILDERESAKIERDRVTAEKVAVVAEKHEESTKLIAVVAEKTDKVATTLVDSGNAQEKKYEDLTHHINGRMDQLLEEVRKAAFASGVKSETDKHQVDKPATPKDDITLVNPTLVNPKLVNPKYEGGDKPT